MERKYKKLEKPVERYYQTTKRARLIRRSAYILYFGSIISLVVLMGMHASMRQSKWRKLIEIQKRVGATKFVEGDDDESTRRYLLSLFHNEVEE